MIISGHLAIGVRNFLFYIWYAHMTWMEPAHPSIWYTSILVIEPKKFNVIFNIWRVIRGQNLAFYDMFCILMIARIVYIDEELLHKNKRINCTCVECLVECKLLHYIYMYIKKMLKLKQFGKNWIEYLRNLSNSTCLIAYPLKVVTTL